MNISQISIDFLFFFKGWLVDFINQFGDLGGFDNILSRILSTESKLTISVIVALLKPWGLCYEYLTQSMIKKYFTPIIVRI
jgi:ubiquitin carboxyl-terminal hydrolase 9/24